MLLSDASTRVDTQGIKPLTPSLETTFAYCLTNPAAPLKSPHRQTRGT